jgi:membrane protease YdiL (CAAX protease family)
MEEPSFGNAADKQGSSRIPPKGFPAYIFFNKSGLRAGWRLCLYVFVVLVLLSGSTYVIAEILHRHHQGSSLVANFWGEILALASAMGAAWLMSVMEGRPFGVYGLPGRNAFGKLFWQGCAFGLIEVSALTGIIAALGAYTFGSLALHGTDILRWALVWAAFFIVVGLCEEFIFRGYALYTLADGIGFWPAALLLAAGFGAVHLRNPGEGWVGAAGVFVVGVFWSFTLKRTGSLWFAVGMHATFDFGETFLFSVPDSGSVFPGHLSNASLHGANWLTGGTPGPEGSVIDFVILLVYFFVFDRLFPARRDTSSASQAEPAI